MNRITVMEALAREYWWSMLHLNSPVARTFFYSQATNEKSRRYWPLLNRRCVSVVVRWPHEGSKADIIAYKIDSPEGK